MSRAPIDESGPGRTISLRLAPMHLGILDRLAKARSMSRSTLVARLLERAERAEHPSSPAALRSVPTEAVAAPPLESVEAVAESVTASVTELCAHRSALVIQGGLKRCRDCGLTRGMDGVWR